MVGVGATPSLTKVIEIDEELRELLLLARLRRRQPVRDEKIASWSAVAISAFARAGLVMDDVVALNERI